MSLFKNILSRVGIGSATVETKLFNTLFVPGQPVKGGVKITGGKAIQEIDAVYLKIKSTFGDTGERTVKEPTEDKTAIENDTYADTNSDGEDKFDVTHPSEIMRLQISDPFSLNPEEKVRFDLDFMLPWDTPATAGKTVTWVETGLDIKMAIDPEDKDYLNVTPHPLAEKVLDAAVELGFRISDVVCEPAPSDMDMRIPFFQKYALKPVRGCFKNRLDEIELVFKPFEASLQIFMEVDRKAKGGVGHFSEMIGTDDAMVNFLVQEKHLPNLKGKIDDIIEEYCA